VFNSASLKRDRIVVEKESDPDDTVHYYSHPEGSWLGAGWTMHLGRVFDRSYFKDLPGNNWRYADKRRFFQLPDSSEHAVTRPVDNHPLLRYGSFAEVAHYGNCPPAQQALCESCAERKYSDPCYDTCEANCDWVVADTAHLEVTDESGTLYRLESKVSEKTVPKSHGWVQNHFRSGFYTTRIVPVVGTPIAVAYHSSSKYPEAISEIAPETGSPIWRIWTTLWGGPSSAD
jgi:hypothetical protein